MSVWLYLVFGLLLLGALFSIRERYRNSNGKLGIGEFLTILAYSVVEAPGYTLILLAILLAGIALLIDTLLEPLHWLLTFLPKGLVVLEVKSREQYVTKQKRGLHECLGEIKELLAI